MTQLIQRRLFEVSVGHPRPYHPTHPLKVPQYLYEESPIIWREEGDQP